MHNSKAPADKSRKRFLNVVYFIDSRQTRTFRVKLSALNIVLSSFAVLFIWTVVSSIWLSVEMETNTVLKQRLQTALITIFDYQAKYENIYENTYEPKITNPQNNLPSTKLSTLSSPTPSAPRPKQSKLSLLPNDSTNDYVSKFISFEGVQANFSKDSTIINFSIRNLKKPNKTDGFVWATLEAIKNGKTIYTVYPDRAKVDSTGQLIDHKLANRYSIRYYKSEQYSFPSHSELGKIVSISVNAMDESGQHLFKRLKINHEQPKNPIVANNSELSRKDADLRN